MAADAATYTAEKLKLWVTFNLADLVIKGVDLDAIRAFIRASVDPATAANYIGIIDSIVRLADDQAAVLLALQRLNVTVTLDATTASINFGINEIPSAAVALNIGVRGDTGQPSPAEYLTDYLRAFLRIQVYAQVVATDGLIGTWPTNVDGSPRPFLFFDGYTVGYGTQRSRETASLVLHLTHWLSNFNFSSAISRVSSPSNPSSLSFDATIGTLTGGAVGGADSVTVIAYQVLGEVNTLRLDFWGYHIQLTNQGGLKSYLEALSRFDRFSWFNLQVPGVVVCPGRAIQPEANSEALSALAQMEPAYLPGQVAGLNAIYDNITAAGDWSLLLPAFQQALLADAGYTYGVPLMLYTNDPASTVQIFNISEGIVHDLHILSSMTLWDLLVGSWVPQFALAVIPMVDRALVVPYTPGLRSVRRFIPATQIFAAEGSITVPRPIRAVGILSWMTGAAGADLNQQRGQFLGAGTVYDTCRDGQIIYKQAPAWLANVVNPSLGISTGKVLTTTSSPVGGTPVNPVKTTMPAAAAEIAKKYAHSLYLQEVLRHRRWSLSGPLRFDICPGSSIAFELARDVAADASLIRAGLQPSPRWMYGTVTRCSTIIDVESLRAETSFQVSHVRTQAENEDDETSTDIHPMWQIPWVGSPLVSEQAFT